jgi:hypothetical protein
VWTDNHKPNANLFELNIPTYFYPGILYEIRKFDVICCSITVRTAGAGYTFFNRMFFAQVDKEAMIIDERSNADGQAANYITEVLSRRHLSGWKDRDIQLEQAIAEVLSQLEGFENPVPKQAPPLPTEPGQ